MIYDPSEKLNLLLYKHGNLVRKLSCILLRENSGNWCPVGPGNISQTKLGTKGIKLTSGLTKASLTYDDSKRKSDLHNRHGGKIMEEAKAGGNASDIRYMSNSAKTILGISHTGGLLNSMWPKRAPGNSPERRNKIRDLWITSGARFMTTLPTTGSQLNREQVEQEQMKLAELARLKGIYDPAVLNRQLQLARSKLFREHTVELIGKKAGSLTPGVDGEVYDEDENDQIFGELVGYLREQLYHPNKYRATPIKRV